PGAVAISVKATIPPLFAARAIRRYCTAAPAPSPFAAVSPCAPAASPCLPPALAVATRNRPTAARRPSPQHVPSLATRCGSASSHLTTLPCAHAVAFSLLRLPLPAFLAVVEVA